ncbi:MAG: hypothetical protein AAGM22_32845, partial [Acidobacteriota bacterium]
MIRTQSAIKVAPGRRSVGRRNALMAAACGCLLAVAGLTADAQETQDGSVEEPFIETVQTSLVNVDVYVTDRRGNPILGLGPEDFELFEDGQPVKLTNFFAVQNGVPALER